MNKIFGVSNLSRLLNLSRPTIYKYIANGMPCTKISEKKYVFDYELVNNWLMKG